MKIIKYTLAGLAVIVVLALAALFFYSRHAAPKYEGEVEVLGLEDAVEVHFDEFGVPHIYSDNDLDAFRALGYVHAQERLWQMELMRRIAPGRLSEIFGKDLLEADRFFRTVGIQEYSKKSAEALRQRKGKVLSLAEAYLEGVNHFQKEGPAPLEYTLLGVKKEPFTLEDIYNVTGYMSFSFANAFKTEPVVTAFAQMGAQYIEAFDLNPEENSETIKSHSEGREVVIAESINRVLDQMPLAPFIGSNSWVLSPRKSATGKVMFCNDPHIGFSQPATWYEAHISTPSMNYYGYHVAGVPFAFLIHNKHLANGLTMFENDDLDFYREKINKEDTTQYWAIDHWESFEVRDELIKVKDSSDVTLTVRSTRHGPVMNSAIESLGMDEPIALWWVYYEFSNHLLEAAHEMAVSTNMAEVKRAASKIHAPGLNVMYGDKAGNIAWWAVGKLVKRPAHVNPKAILEGATGKDDPLGYYPFEANPQAENPPSGYVYSANNQPVMNIEDTAILYPGYYLPDNRAKRIVEVLNAAERFSREDMKALFLDNQLAGVTEIKNIFVASVDGAELTPLEKAAFDQISSWNGAHDEQAMGAAVYHAWIMYMYKLAVKDHLEAHFEGYSDALYAAFMNAHLMKRSIKTFVAAESSPWWDDMRTEEVEGRNDILHRAFKKAVAYLEETLGDDVEDWPWSAAHTVEFSHPLGKVAALKPLFNVGPFGVGGANMVVNNLGFPYREEELFKTTFGPSTRRIIDFSDINSSESILPTGQSGNPR